MTRGLLKSTTMLALAASLAMPVAAQNQQDKADCAQTPDAKACLDAAPKAKGKQATAAEPEASAAETGVTAEAEAQADAQAETGAAGGAEAAPEATAESAAPVQPEQPAAEAAAQAAPAEPAPEAQMDAEAQAEGGEAAPVETQPEVTATEPAPAPKAEAEAPAATADAEATAPEGDAVAADELKQQLEAEQAGDTAAPEASADATAERGAEPEAQPEEQAEEQAAETTAEPTAAPEPTDAPEMQAETAGETEGTDELKQALEAQQAAEGEGTAQVTPEAQTEAEATAESEATADAEPTAGAETPAAEAEAAAEPAAEPEAPSAEQQAEAVAREEEQQQTAAAAAAASSEETPDDAELVEETLTEADVRTSDEDFATDLRAQATAEQQAAAAAEAKKAKKDDDEDGLSNFEKAALVGLGTFALSQILDDGAQVVQNTGDRVVVEQDGQYRVLRNDDVLLRQPGSEVKTYRYNDGSTRTVVAYDDGNTVETVKTSDGRVLRRTRILPDGQRVVLFDDTQSAQQVVVSELPQANTQRLNFREMDGEELAAALSAQEAQGVNRAFSLNQIRNIDRVRHLVPEISVDTVTFQTNSAAIRPGEAEELAALGNAMKRMIEQNPGEVFLIEGHTDATGAASYNLALSDRRAESVALALSEYFDVPPENMVLQGYGESDLAVQTQADERENRRAAVRRITPLLQGS
ncbi:OmpA family protein [Salipiger mangrovisoli]|uniref:OmpA family protein n=1 Tax=Salipiger mangrovisoli TaxID=2865933 RepID=A0ABR9X3Y0_9RHOB|nr:OmpA family protein [Salipiger mangrovisoli]MBE9638141.1 OmpA family protein [Salipiger mangrovisoli]